MTKHITEIKQSFRDTLLFISCYFIVFLFLIGIIRDSTQTTGMFILIDFFVVVIATIYYFIFGFLFQLTNRKVGIIIEALSFFILTEFAVF